MVIIILTGNDGNNDDDEQALFLEGKCFHAGPCVISLKLNLQVREPDMLAYSPIAKNISLTFMAVFADVSIKRRALSSA